MWNKYSVLDNATGEQVSIMPSYESAIKEAIRFYEDSSRVKEYSVINHIPLFDTSDIRDMTKHQYKCDGDIGTECITAQIAKEI